MCIRDRSNINQGIEEYKMTAGAVLLDVRTPPEYKEGHIPVSYTHLDVYKRQEYTFHDN